MQVVDKCLEFDAAYNSLSSATDDEIRNDLHRLKRIDRAAKAAPYVCSVSGCGYRTPHKGNFDRHEQKLHGDIGEAHVCSVSGCGYKTPHKVNFDRHQKQHDGDIGKALAAERNGELHSEDWLAQIRAASESDASCAQIVGAWTADVQSFSDVTLVPGKAVLAVLMKKQDQLKCFLPSVKD
jgi:hypothetical protein